MSKNYYQNLPKKRMGAGALFFNQDNDILIIKPSYKDHWSILGGVVEENESPRVSCVREIKEEIGLEIKDLKFLCVDWTSSVEGKGESLQFIFFGGVLTVEQISNIKLAEEEISEYKFLPLEKALPFLSEKLRERIPRCVEALKNGTALYLEDAK